MFGLIFPQVDNDLVGVLSIVAPMGGLDEINTSIDLSV